MTAQLELSLIAEINDAYEAAMSAADAVRRNVGSAVQNAYRCGAMLNRVSATVGKSNFPTWLREHCPKLEKPVTVKWMRFSAAVDRGDIQLDDVRSMRKLLETVNVIEHPEREEQQTAKQLNPEVVIIRHVTNTMTELTKLSERDPVEKWPAMRKWTLRAQLEPLVKLYERL